ncbi:MAG: right-handed parallel beta-helix repeat-containing protein [Candidatus Cloacimonetes bacterium]|nr:right-handed parallel beta-helix repeat-containing protein [Candidatus Cloacimonadota bacterium]
MRSISLLLIALFISAVGLNATIITVNWDGSGDYITIQEGINASSNGDTVLVYPGTYQETINYNGKSITVGSLFLITADSTYIESTGINSINSYAVRFESCEDNTSIIKGLTLGIHYHSSGVYCNNSSPIISDNIINTPDGYGIRCDNLSAPVIFNNRVTNASRGIQLSYNSFPQILNNNLYDNGKGIFVSSSSPLIKGNTISGSARAIEISTASNMNILSNFITNSYFGIEIHSNIQTENINIINNLITNCYNGINCYSSAVQIINNSILFNSNCGIYAWFQPEIINCIIWGNVSNFNYDANPIISHSCLEGVFPINGIDNGGNIFNYPCFVDTLSEDYHLQMASPCREAGTIDTTGLNLPEFDLDGNLRIQDGNGDGIVIIDMGCYESETVTDPGFVEGTVYLVGGNGNVEETQVYIGVPVIPDTNGYYQIVIGEGTYNVTAHLHGYIPQTIEDVDVVAGEVTYGVDFYMDYCGNIITVNQDGTGNYLIIQEGINIAENGDTVLVYPGTYIENINYFGRNIVVGSLFLTTQDSAYIEQTIIDGDGVGNVVTFENGEDTTAVLIGFTIQNSGEDSSWLPEESDAGVNIFNSIPIIEHNVIKENGNTGICINSYVWNFLNTIIRNNVISNNSQNGIWCIISVNITDNFISDNTESGIRCSSDSFDLQLYIENNIIINNNDGILFCSDIIKSTDDTRNNIVIIINNTIQNNTISGISCDNFSPTIIGNKISANVSGILCYVNAIIGSSNPDIINNLITDNVSGIDCLYQAAPTVINGTITNNTNGVSIGYECDLIIENSIIWSNDYSITFYNETSNATISYSCIEGGFPAQGTNAGGNIYDDPLFFDPDIGDYHLTENSPCIDAGNPDTTGLNLPPFDLDGNPRIYNGIIDMGCYEWQGVGIDDWYKPLPDVVLSQNYPNPFSGSTTISFFSTKNTPVLRSSATAKGEKSTKIKIYNIKRQLIKQFIIHPDYNREKINEVMWDGKDESGKPVSSGLYFYQLKIGDKLIDTKKSLLMR